MEPTPKPNYVQVEGHVKAMGLAIQLGDTLLQDAFRELFDCAITQSPIAGEVREYGRMRITVEKLPAAADE